jgi:DNA invertase Pin-like site-specific DNA recombinase
MSNAIHFATLGDDHPIGSLLDMIERRAPFLMKVGGGSLMQNQDPKIGRKLSNENLAKIDQMFTQGVSIRTIANEIGLHEQTVWRHTRKLRNVKPRK